MPLPMVHLCAANKLIDYINIKDISSFYLGSISPDAVHMREDYIPDDKSKSHLFVEDITGF